LALAFEQLPPDCGILLIELPDRDGRHVAAAPDFAATLF
jgi:hypothetical protein